MVQLTVQTQVNRPIRAFNVETWTAGCPVRNTEAAMTHLQCRAAATHLSMSSSSMMAARSSRVPAADLGVSLRSGASGGTSCTADPTVVDASSSRLSRARHQLLSLVTVQRAAAYVHGSPSRSRRWKSGPNSGCCIAVCADSMPADGKVARMMSSSAVLRSRCHVRDNQPPVTRLAARAVLLDGP